MERILDCGALFKQIHDALEKRANNSLRAQGLTLAQMTVLSELRTAPEKQLSLKELERRLHVAQSTAAGIVVRLEQKGFVEGFGDTQDRRIKMVRMTSAGENCCHMGDRNMEETEATLLLNMTEAERTNLLILLKKVAENLR